jgi:Major capsid protein
MAILDTATVLNSGATDGTNTGTESTDRELLIEDVTGEVLASFEKTTAMEGKYRKMDANGAKSKRFEHVGGIGAYYHNAGEHIDGLNVNHEKSTVELDRPLLSSFFTDEFDEQMLHYDARKEYTRQMGEVLAQKYDRNIQMKAILASRLENKLAEFAGGTVIVDAALVNADIALRVNAFAKQVIAARKEFIKKNVTGEIFCITDPDTYFEVIEHRELLNKDYGEVGSYSEGSVFKIGGVSIEYHNYIPQVNAQDVANTEFYDKYHGIDCTGTKAVLFTKDAVGVLRGGDVTIDIWDDKGREGTWTKAKIACGMGVLRPECSVEIRSAALPLNWGQLVYDSNRIGAGKLPVTAANQV